MDRLDLPYCDDICTDKPENSSYSTNPLESGKDKWRDDIWNYCTSRVMSIEDLDENPLFLPGTVQCDHDDETTPYHGPYLEMRQRSIGTSKESICESSFFQIYNG